MIIQSYNFVNHASEVSQLKDNLPRYTLRIPQILLDKLAYVSEYEGRTKNKEIEQLIKKRIQEFEHIHEPIPEKNAEEKGVL